MPPIWADALAERLAADDDLVVDAVAAARALPSPKEPHAGLAAALRGVAGTEYLTTTVRLDALATVPGGLSDVGDEQFALVLYGLANDNPVPLRSAAADVLSRATLTSAQLHELCHAIESVSPLELDRLLGPFERSADEQVALKLLASLEKAAALPSLRIDSLRLRLAKYGPAVLEGVARLETLVNVDAATQRQRIEDLLGATMASDIRRGQAVFNNSKSACIVCHKFGYLGGTVGPDLTRIGQIRTERDLLESILFPSLSFVRSYEPVVIVTTDGRVVNGLVRNETADELVIATGINQEARVRRADIEELRPSTVSVMPAGLDKQLTPQELADLVAFLKNAK
jgi:putative heme-binding domain-containing protein